LERWKNKWNQGARRYNVNQDFFKIWTKDMAYVLGFWWADGFIDKECFGISQHKNDKYILENILKVMESNHPIKKTCKNNYFICIYSKEIIEDIKNLGGKERKSLDIGFPTVPQEYLPDFIRGYFDGDGSVSILKDNNNLETDFTSGSKELAYKLLEAIESSIKGIHGIIYIKVRKKGEKLFDYTRPKDSIYYSTRFSNNNSILLRDFMYRDSSLKLLRKYNKFYKIKGIIVLKTGFMPYSEAKEYIKKFNIQSKTEWECFCKSGSRPITIPSFPSRTYLNKGWISWKEWLGYEKERVKGGISCWVPA